MNPFSDTLAQFHLNSLRADLGLPGPEPDIPAEPAIPLRDLIGRSPVFERDMIGPKVPDSPTIYSRNPGLQRTVQLLKLRRKHVSSGNYAAVSLLLRNHPALQLVRGPGEPPPKTYLH